MSTETITKSTKEPRACECGCGGSPKGARAKFLPGHDAKLKNSLIDAAIKGGKRAIIKLEKFGWTSHLEKKLAALKAGKAAPAAV